MQHIQYSHVPVVSLQPVHAFGTMPPTTVSTQPQTYSPSEIADATDRHPESIRRDLRNGKIEGHKMGERWKVTPSALRDWLGDELFEVYFGQEGGE